MLEDPSAPPIYRTSGPPPYPIANNPCIPDSITPRLVTLRDRITTASLLPISTAAEVPLTLLSYLCAQFNLEIEKGDTYPMTVPLSLEEFGSYWFQSFGAIMLLGEVKGKDELWVLEQKGDFWESVCLGTFYIKPNYPGRSSHVCNGGFIVTDAARNRGVGRLMGEGYLEWAPKLVGGFISNYSPLIVLQPIVTLLLSPSRPISFFLPGIWLFLFVQLVLLVISL